GGRDRVEILLVVDLAGLVELAGGPLDGAGAGAVAFPPAVQHRPAREHDRRNVDGCGRHDGGRRGLVTAGGQHDAIKRIAVEHFNQAEISEVAVERRGRPLAGLLDRMHRKLDRDAAGVTDAVAHALGELQVMAVAGGKVRTRLCDADDRSPGGDFRPGEAEVQVTLEVECGRLRITWMVEPVARAQDALSGRFVLLLACSVLLLACHDRLLAGLPAAPCDRPSNTRKARANPWRGSVSGRSTALAAAAVVREADRRLGV